MKKVYELLIDLILTHLNYANQRLHGLLTNDEVKEFMRLSFYSMYEENKVLKEKLYQLTGEKYDV